MVAASMWRPRQPSFEETNATDQTSTVPAARTPGPAREMVRQPFFRSEAVPTHYVVELRKKQPFHKQKAPFYVDRIPIIDDGFETQVDSL